MLCENTIKSDTAAEILPQAGMQKQGAAMGPGAGRAEGLHKGPGRGSDVGPDGWALADGPPQKA